MSAWSAPSDALTGGPGGTGQPMAPEGPGRDELQSRRLFSRISSASPSKPTAVSCRPGARRRTSGTFLNVKVAQKRYVRR